MLTEKELEVLQMSQKPRGCQPDDFIEFAWLFEQMASASDNCQFVRALHRVRRCLVEIDYHTIETSDY